MSGQADKSKFTPEQRSAQSARAKARMAKLTAEERSALGKKGNTAKLAKYTPKELSKAVKAGWAKITPEQRAEIGKKRWANFTPAQRDAIAEKKRASWAKLTPDEQSARAKARWAKVTPKRRAEISRAAKARAAKAGPHERSKAGKAAWKNLTAEERSSRNKARWARIPLEQRSQRAKARWEKATPAARAKHGRNIKAAWAKIPPERRAAIAEKTSMRLANAWKAAKAIENGAADERSTTAIEARSIGRGRPRSAAHETIRTRWIAKGEPDPKGKALIDLTKAGFPEFTKLKPDSPRRKSLLDQVRMMIIRFRSA